LPKVVSRHRGRTIMMLRRVFTRQRHPLRCAAATLATTVDVGWGSSIRRLQCIDVHCEGEAARVVVGGLPHIPGAIHEKRALMMKPPLDAIRKLLILEPRGYPCQNVNYVLPPTHPKAAYDVIIAEQNCIYPAMSGHNMMCVATALLETGMVPMMEPLSEFTLHTPAGLVGVQAECSAGKATRVLLRNAPSFLRPEDMDIEVDVPGGVGKVRLDVAFGGMWYAVVDAASVGLRILPQKGKDLCRIGEMIKVACREQHPVNHPEYDYPGCDILVFTEGRRREGNIVFAKNTVVMSKGALDWNDPATWTAMLDRSPCGTGTSAVMASLHKRGELALGETFVHEGILGTSFRGSLEEQTTVGAGLPAVVPTISGRCWITQHCDVVCHPSDPFPHGYTVGDIW